jgi:hypothetical protein
MSTAAKKPRKPRAAKPKAVQVTGPGVGIPELEHCPEMYHVDFTQEQFEVFLRDPVRATKQFGLDPTVNHITIVGFGARPRRKPVWCGVKKNGGWDFHLHDGH